jgi:hypothetical protein
MNWAHKSDALFVSHRFESAIPEAHIEEVLVDTLYETIIVTAALHCAQYLVHPAKITKIFVIRNPHACIPVINTIFWIDEDPMFQLY